MGDMKLGENKVGPVLNECTKFHNFVPYGSRGCHRLQWERKMNKNSGVVILPLLGSQLHVVQPESGAAPKHCHQKPVNSSEYAEVILPNHQSI